MGPDDRRHLSRPAGHSGGVTHVVALDRERALSASPDKTLRLWDLTTGDTLRVLQGHSDRVNHVVALDRERALSASGPHPAAVGPHDRRHPARPAGPCDGVNHLVALDRERALSASRDSTLRLWDLTTGNTLRVLQGHSNRVSHVLALDRERALSASQTKPCGCGT